MAHSLAIKHQNSQEHPRGLVLVFYFMYLDKFYAMRRHSVRCQVCWGTILRFWQGHCLQLNDQHALLGKEPIDDFKTLERLQKDLILVRVLGPTEQRSSSAGSGDFKENGSSMTFMIVIAIGKVNCNVAIFGHTCEGCPCKLFADLRVASTTFPLD